MKRSSIIKISKDIKNDYRICNIVLLYISIFILLLPVVLGILEKISPVLTRCPYLELTGKPCPLCGGTRFIKNIKNSFNDLSYFFNFFGIIIVIVLFQIVFRTINIFKKTYSDKLIKIDIFVHILIFVAYTIYEICFIIYNK